MYNTVTFITSQYSGDRIIKSASEIAQSTGSSLQVVGIMDSQYATDPKAVDYLFKQSKEHDAAMHLVFREDTLNAMKEKIAEYSTKYIVTGMPSSNKSVLYDLWKEFPDKSFYTVDLAGVITEVANSKVATTV